MKALLFERERLEGENRTGLIIKRDPEGIILDIQTVPEPALSSSAASLGSFTRKGAPVMWIDLQHGQTENGSSEEIRMELIGCPFMASASIRLYVDLCNDLDKDLFTNEDPGMPERFCQIIRRQLQDPRKTTSLRFIGTPKSYVDGTISSVDGVLTKDVSVDGRGSEFPIPRGETLPTNSFDNKLIDRGEYEENYEDDFMIGVALGLPVDSLEPRGMRLIRNDLAQLRLFDLKGRQLDEQEKNTYRLVFTYGGREHLIGNFAHFLRQDSIGTRIPHRLTLPLEEERFQVPPLSPDEVTVPKPPPSIPVVERPGAPGKGGKSALPLPSLETLSLSDDDDAKRNPTGLEPEYMRRDPYEWADDDLIVEEPRFSLDALTNKVGQRQRRGREKDPPGSPASSSDSSSGGPARDEKKSRITL